MTAGRDSADLRHASDFAAYSLYSPQESHERDGPLLFCSHEVYVYNTGIAAASDDDDDDDDDDAVADDDYNRCILTDGE